MIGSIRNPSVAVEVGKAFGEASSAVRERIDRASAREATGQGGTREDTLTDDLMDALEGSIGDSLNRVCKHLADLGSNVRIEFTSSKAPQGEETAFGLDLGLRVVIESPDYAAQKAILVQCKRMYRVGDSWTFPKLRDDGEHQARKMLEATPASFFFLFNGGESPDLLEMMHSAPYLLWDTPFWWGEHPTAIRSYFDPGVTVLPATRVLAMSQAARLSNANFPIRAQDVLAGSIPLGHFIAGLFAPCFVGDVRTPILQLATPPSMRSEITGLDAEVPELGQLRAKRFHKLKIVKPPIP
jgi:hypothetical protein